MKQKDTKFKDTIGRFLTQSLFIELEFKKNTALYSLGEEDRTIKGITYPSLKRLYLELEDPTEYEFAITYFYSWPHWLRICQNIKLATFIDEWRAELEIKLRSRGIKKMIATAGSSTKDAVTASKWLSDRGWTKRKAGAPSKDEIARERKIAAGISSEVEEDRKRLKLVSNE